MGEVKRYDPDVSRRGDAYMDKKSDGDYVQYDDYATLEAENAKLRAELERRAPDGWKLVPVEPTSEMMEAAFKCYGNDDDCYRVMLAAAPSAPKADEKPSTPIDDDDIAVAAKYASAIAAARKGEGE